MFQQTMLVLSWSPKCIEHPPAQGEQLADKDAMTGRSVLVHLTCLVADLTRSISTPVRVQHE